MSKVASLHIKRIWVDYKPDKTDAAKTVPIEMIEYSPIGKSGTSSIICSIRSLRDVLPMTDSSNPAIVFAHARWDFIKPRYEAWKSGQEMPVDGTPLAAWNGVTPEQSEVFKRNGVRTVEEISQLTDAHVERFPIAHMRQLIAQAKNFLAASDATRFAKLLSDKEGQIDSQAAELADQREQTKALLAKVDQLAEIVANREGDSDFVLDPTTMENNVPVKRRGRPPKVQSVA